MTLVAARRLDAEFLARARCWRSCCPCSSAGCRCPGTGTPAHFVLPAVTLGAALAAMLARMTRATLIDELRELYVLAARARGLSRARAVVAHALRNSLIPVVTIIGLQLGAVLTGTIITETIFAWPGVGRLLIQAISFRDYPLVQGCILFIAVTYVTMNLLVDLAYAWLDPEDSLPMMGRAGVVIVLGGDGGGRLRPVDPALRSVASGPAAAAGGAVVGASARAGRARPRPARAARAGRARLAVRGCRRSSACLPSSGRRSARSPAMPAAGSTCCDRPRHGRADGVSRAFCWRLRWSRCSVRA